MRALSQDWNSLEGRLTPKSGIASQLRYRASMITGFAQKMIRVLIADDHPIVREGFKRVVAAVEGLEVAGEVSSGDEVLEAAARLQPDVLLLDISMPGPGFLEVMRALRRDLPQQRILVISVHAECDYAARAIRAGANGYLTKDQSTKKLAEAIRDIHEGRQYITPALAEQLALGLLRGEAAEPHELLSEREYQVLCRFGSGRTVKKIAEELGLSPKTVSTYRSRILEKTELQTSADLIRYAIEHGLTD